MKAQPVSAETAPAAVTPPAATPPAATLPADVPAAPSGAPVAELLQWLDLGGPVLWLLAGLSVLAAAIILAKLGQFSLARLDRTGLGLVARAAQAAAAESGGGRAAAVDAGRRAAHAIMRPLEAGLPTLGMIAMLSPLIGLLGTVIGMISAFQALAGAAATVDPAILSGGIWVALLTTAAGLVVAIPATLAHGWFEARLSRFAADAECAIGAALAQAPGSSGPGLRMAAE